MNINLAVLLLSSLISFTHHVEYWVDSFYYFLEISMLFISGVIKNVLIMTIYLQDLSLFLYLCFELAEF